MKRKGRDRKDDRYENEWRRRGRNGRKKTLIGR